MTIPLSPQTPASKVISEYSKESASSSSLQGSDNLIRGRVSATVDHMKKLDRSWRLSEIEAISEAALKDGSLTSFERGKILVERVNALIKMQWKESAEISLKELADLGLSQLESECRRFESLWKKMEDRGSFHLPSKQQEPEPQMRVTVFYLLERLKSFNFPHTGFLTSCEHALEDFSLNRYERAHLLTVYIDGLVRVGMYKKANERVEEVLALNIDSVSSKVLRLKEKIAKKLGEEVVSPESKRPRLKSPQGD